MISCLPHAYPPECGDLQQYEACHQRGKRCTVRIVLHHVHNDGSVYDDDAAADIVVEGFVVTTYAPLQSVLTDEMIQTSHSGFCSSTNIPKPTAVMYIGKAAMNKNGGKLLMKRKIEEN